MEIHSLYPYIAMALFLLLGLVIYERTGLRLGGVVVLPLLLVYALVDLNAVWMFGAVSAAAFAVGHVLHERTLLYGRRLFIVFLVVGLACSALAMAALGTPAAPLMLALLPGIFAFNLHREGNYTRGTSAFMLWLGLILGAVSFVSWTLDNLAGTVPALVIELRPASVTLHGGLALAAAATLEDAGGAAE